MLRSIHHTLRERIPGYYSAYKFALSLIWLLRSLRILHLSSAWEFLSIKRGAIKGNVPVRLVLRGNSVSAWVRPNTSDILVFEQMFLKQEYAGIQLKDPAWIIDAGANIGLSALYFLLRYPTSKIIAIEPSAGNFEMMAKNLAPYAERCHLMQSAVWYKTGMVALDSEHIPGAEWAIQVREESDGKVPTCTLPQLLADHQITNLSLLKMDIEGAEAEVFAHDTSWLAQVEMMAIELHGPEAVRLVDEKAGEYFRTTWQDREIRIYSENDRAGRKTQQHATP